MARTRSFRALALFPGSNSSFPILHFGPPNNPALALVEIAELFRVNLDYAGSYVFGDLFNSGYFHPYSPDMTNGEVVVLRYKDPTP